MSAHEYLKGEAVLKTPQGGIHDATARIRVFHDSDNHDENVKVNDTFQYLKQ